MQKSHYSKKEKIGWGFISLLFLGIVIALLGEPIGKLLSIIGLSQILSNNIGEAVTHAGFIIMLLGIICVPIGIIMVIRAMKNIKHNQIVSVTPKHELEPEVKTVKKYMKWIHIVYLLIGLALIFVVHDEYIDIALLTVGILWIISFSILLIYIYHLKKLKEKEGKLFNFSLDLLYEGKLKNGKANGQGIAYFYDGTKKCEGTFKDGKLDGEGRVYYPNGNIRCKGKFKNGFANGKGTIYDSEGNIASQGTFKNNKLEGKGISYYISGNIRYKGNFKNGLANGKGTIYYPSGNIASQGTFKNDKLEGRGISYYDNGNKYQEGTFRNGKLENFGKIFYLTGGLLYEGEFKSGLPHGEGIMYNANGCEIHKGQFKKGKIWDLSKRFKIILYKLLFWEK